MAELQFTLGTTAFLMTEDWPPSAAEWTHFPAAWHDRQDTLSFADGHAELHRWLESTTLRDFSQFKNANIALPAYHSRDWVWLVERTSSRAQE